MLFPNPSTQLCAVTIATPDEVWAKFLESKDYKMVMRLFQAACNPSIQQRKHRISPSKQCWHRALARACELWLMLKDCETGDSKCTSSYTKQKYLVLLEQKYVAVLSEPLWTTISFLMKGTYYVDNDIPLNKLVTEEPHQFLLHSTIGSLPACKAYGRFRQFALVFHRVLDLHRDQLTVAGPVDGHLPIHVAASNKGRFFQCTRRLSEGRTIEEHMLKIIIDASPAFAISTRDAKSMYPLQLACQSGHTWKYGLEQLFQASPNELGSAGVMLAGSTSLKSTCESSSTSPSPTGWLKLNIAGKNGKQLHSPIRQRCVVSDEGCYYESEKGHRDALDSLFKLIRADPASLIQTLRVPLEASPRWRQ